MNPLAFQINNVFGTTAEPWWSQALTLAVGGIIAFVSSVVSLYLFHWLQRKKDQKQADQERYRSRHQCYLRYKASAKYAVECMRLTEMHLVEGYFYELASEDEKKKNQLERAELFYSQLTESQSRLSDMEVEYAKAQRQLQVDLADIDTQFEQTTELEQLVNAVSTFSYTRTHPPYLYPKTHPASLNQGSPQAWREDAHSVAQRQCQAFDGLLGALSEYLRDQLKNESGNSFTKHGK